jgi:hypothetical protein
LWPSTIKSACTSRAERAIIRRRFPTASGGSGYHFKTHDPSVVAVEEIDLLEWLTVWSPDGRGRARASINATQTVSLRPPGECGGNGKKCRRINQSSFGLIQDHGEDVDGRSPRAFLLTIDAHTVILSRRGA